MSLKQPPGSYAARLEQFMALIDQVRRLSPTNEPLWEVMDSTAFQDTEAALHTTLYNAGRENARLGSHR